MYREDYRLPEVTTLSLSFRTCQKTPTSFKSYHMTVKELQRKAVGTSPTLCPCDSPPVPKQTCLYASRVQNLQTQGTFCPHLSIWTLAPPHTQGVFSQTVGRAALCCLLSPPGDRRTPALQDRATLPLRG